MEMGEKITSTFYFDQRLTAVGKNPFRYLGL